MAQNSTGKQRGGVDSSDWNPGKVGNRVLGIVRNVVPYVKELRPIVGSVNAAILMMQLDYWFDKYPGGFYKFLDPCPNNDHYREGDSWSEELGFSAYEFRGAFDCLGVRYGSKREFDAAPDKFQGMLYCSYHDKIRGLTFYYRNHDLTNWILNLLTGDKFTDLNKLQLRRPTNFSYVDLQTSLTELKDVNLQSGIKPNQGKGSRAPQRLHPETTPETTPEKIKRNPLTPLEGGRRYAPTVATQGGSFLNSFPEGSLENPRDPEEEVQEEMIPTGLTSAQIETNSQTIPKDPGSDQKKPRRAATRKTQDKTKAKPKKKEFEFWQLPNGSNDPVFEEWVRKQYPAGDTYFGNALAWARSRIETHGRDYWDSYRAEIEAREAHERLLEANGMLNRSACPGELKSGHTENVEEVPTQRLSLMDAYRNIVGESAN